MRQVLVMLAVVSIYGESAPASSCPMNLLTCPTVKFDNGELCLSAAHSEIVRAQMPWALACWVKVIGMRSSIKLPTAL